MSSSSDSFLAKAASLAIAVLCHLIFVVPVPAGTGYTKIKWQKIADERDEILTKQSQEEFKEKQLPVS